MLDSFAALITFPTLARFVNVHTWIWPFFEIIHFFGMALLVGCIGILDLRMLGVAKGLPVRPLERLVPWGVFGFILALVSGIIFVIADATGPPATKFANLAFQLKMLLMFLAGVNVAVFYFSGIAERAHETGAGQDAPASAKVIAFLSIFCWIAVIYFGRMIMYTDDLILHRFFVLD